MAHLTLDDLASAGPNWRDWRPHRTWLTGFVATLTSNDRCRLDLYLDMELWWVQVTYAPYQMTGEVVFKVPSHDPHAALQQATEFVDGNLFDAVLENMGAS